MKTPTVDDPKPDRENLGPTGPAKVSNEKKGKERDGAGSVPSGDSGTASEIEKTIDRKRSQTAPD